MKSFIQRPYSWFLIAIPVFYFALLLYGGSYVVLKSDSVVGVYKIGQNYFIPCILFALWSFLHFIVFRVSKFQPNVLTSVVHLMVTVFYPFLLLIYFIEDMKSPVHNIESKDFSALLYYIDNGSVFFVLAQPLFFIYLAFLLVKSFLTKK